MRWLSLALLLLLVAPPMRVPAEDPAVATTNLEASPEGGAKSLHDLNLAVVESASSTIQSRVDALASRRDSFLAFARRHNAARTEKEKEKVRAESEFIASLEDTTVLDGFAIEKGETLLLAESPRDFDAQLARIARETGMDRKCARLEPDDPRFERECAVKIAECGRIGLGAENGDVFEVHLSKDFKTSRVYLYGGNGIGAPTSYRKARRELELASCLAMGQAGYRYAPLVLSDDDNLFLQLEMFGLSVSPTAGSVKECESPSMLERNRGRAQELAKEYPSEGRLKTAQRVLAGRRKACGRAVEQLCRNVFEVRGSLALAYFDDRCLPRRGTRRDVLRTPPGREMTEVEELEQMGMALTISACEGALRRGWMWRAQAPALPTRCGGHPRPVKRAIPGETKI
jgi:hypothetical protein